MLNKHGKFLIAIVLLTLVVLVIWLIPWPSGSRGLSTEQTAWEGQKLVTDEHVTEYIQGWLSKQCKKRRDKQGREACYSVVATQKRWKRSVPLGKLIDRVADERYIDPLIVAVVVARESSFNEKVPDGDIGEQGLMQVHGLAKRQALKAGHDLTTSEGQLQAGTDYLVRCANRCDGTLLQTLSAYQSGRCKTSAYGPRLRTKDVRRLRGQVRPQLLAALGDKLIPR